MDRFYIKLTFSNLQVHLVHLAKGKEAVHEDVNYLKFRLEKNDKTHLPRNKTSGSVWINGWFSLQLSSTEFFKSLLLSFSPNLDEFNPDIPEWRQDVGRVIKRAVLQVSDFLLPLWLCLPSFHRFILSLLSFMSLYLLLPLSPCYRSIISYNPVVPKPFRLRTHGYLQTTVGMATTQYVSRAV